MPIPLAATIPPMTVVPMIWRETAPAPLAIHNGTHPRMNANDVIRIGLKRSRAPSMRSFRQRPAFLEFVFGELDDQNGVLSGQADQHDQADLRVHVGLDLHHICGRKKPNRSCGAATGLKRRQKPRRAYSTRH